MAAGYFSRPEDKFDNSYTPLRYKLYCTLFAGMLCFLVILLSTSLADYEYEPFAKARSEQTTEYNAASLFCFTFQYMSEALLTIGESIGKMVQGDFGVTGISTDGFDKVFNSAVGAMKTIGFALCLFFFIMTLVDLLTSERLSFEIFWKHFLKLILGVFMVDNADKVKDFVIDFGNAFITDINTGLLSLTNGVSNGTDHPFNVHNGDFIKALVEFAETKPLGWLILLGLAFLVGIFPMLIGIVFKGATILIAFSRFLELYLRCTFLPVALALMTDDGWRGAGGRYIKKIIAVSVQGVALIVIGSLIGAAVANIFTDLATVKEAFTIETMLELCFKVIITSLGFGLAGLSLMFKSMGIVNDVFGV